MLLAVTLSGCAVASTAADGRLQVVTSTDVYAAIVRAIAGSHVDVTALIDSPASSRSRAPTSSSRTAAVTTTS
jgi:zinc/manganese transport system substrate-binding protein